MTTEEKAKAYDEALERAQKATRAGSDVAMDIVQYIFPKLQETESEDDRIRESLISLIETIGEYYISEETRNGYVAWLKKQKEQKPVEWSEEDERALNHVIVALSMYANGEIPYILPSQLLEDVERLKSLRPQPHWKPSDEQMSALLNAEGLARGQYEKTLASILANLYNDLKKL